jgi:thiol:disulfide interchange protein
MKNIALLMLIGFISTGCAGMKTTAKTEMSSESSASRQETAAEQEAVTHSEQAQTESAAASQAEQSRAEKETVTIEVPPSTQPATITITRERIDTEKKTTARTKKAHRESDSAAAKQTTAMTEENVEQAASVDTSARATQTPSTWSLLWPRLLAFGVILLIAGQVAARTTLAIFFPWLRFFDVLRWFGR